MWAHRIYSVRMAAYMGGAGVVSPCSSRPHKLGSRPHKLKVLYIQSISYLLSQKYKLRTSPLSVTFSELTH